MKLYSYWRSTAAYRVRIALALKGIDYDYVPVNLVKNGGEQKQSAYKSKNPQGLVPLLEVDGHTISQSLAIMRYLDSVSAANKLFPSDPILAAKIESFVLGICCDIHPLNNLRVIKYLEADLDIDADKRLEWYHHWLSEGFEAMESTLSNEGKPFCFTDQPTAADICLVAQIYNAHRFNFDMSNFPELRRINDKCLAMVEFKQAIPENQPDAD